MNLETKIDARLWQSIQSSYTDRNFTGAILDSIYFLANLIREKTGLESDGVSLVGQALGGKSPKLKVNKLQSESDINIQSGVEQLLRGVFQGIRNPRSHEKYNDSQEDAVSIILFINFIIKIIDQSKTQFSRTSYLDQVFDKNFVENNRYAELLVSEIPVKQRFEVFIDVYRQKEKGEKSKLKYFMQELLKVLGQDDQEQACQIISEELKTTESDETIRIVLNIFPSECWGKYEEIARLRIENKLLNSVADGRYSPKDDKCFDGALGTWSTGLIHNFILKDKFITVLANKLFSSDDFALDYVFKFFWDYLPELSDPPTPWLAKIIKRGLVKGDKRFYLNLHWVMNGGPNSWIEAFSESYKNFKPSQASEDTPDEDVPF
jgi:uncharacterized protein (TIGR02391 family)